MDKKKLGMVLGKISALEKRIKKLEELHESQTKTTGE